MLAVQPHEPTAMSRMSMTSASPGRAPSIANGPVTGLTRLKSRPGTSAVIEPAFSWPSLASAVSTVISSPGVTWRSG